MKPRQNEGLAPVEVKRYKKLAAESAHGYVVISDDENTDELCHFRFAGIYEGKEVVYDTVLYTLRLAYESELLDLAEAAAASHFPDYEKKLAAREAGESPDEWDEEIGGFIADAIMEMEEEGEVKVQEHADVDPDAEYGIGLDAGLWVDRLTPALIQRFIGQFKSDTLNLDTTWVSFQTREEGEK